MHVLQIDMHHTCLALRATCGSFNCTTQLGQHLQLVADRPNTHAIIGMPRTGNTAISARDIDGTLCDACLHHSRAAGVQRYAVVATLVYGVLPKCEAVARFKPGFRHVTHHTLPCTRGLRCLTCANLLRTRSRLLEARASMATSHTQTGMQLSVPCVPARGPTIGAPGAYKGTCTLAPSLPAS
jgi:hypothetical protein